MAGGQVMSSQASKIQRRLSPYFPVFSIRRYSEGSKTDDHEMKKGKLIEEERADSTAEVFRKVAEEKTGRRGVGVLGNHDHVEENSTDSVSQTLKDPPGNANSGR